MLNNVFKNDFWYTWYKWRCTVPWDCEEITGFYSMQRLGIWLEWVAWIFFFFFYTGNTKKIIAWIEAAPEAHNYDYGRLDLRTYNLDYNNSSVENQKGVIAIDFVQR